MNDAVERARALLNTPFVHLGRDGKGIDCIGLVAHAVAYDAAELPAYPRDPVNGELERYLEEALGPPTLTAPITDDELQAGDIAVMQYRGPLRHVGLVADHPTIKGVHSLIHTDSMVGKVTEHILDAKWLRRIEKVWRL